jgi:ABC-2 type transport system permease protein
VILPVVKKELKHYFFSPVAYVVICIFLIIAGWFFSNALFITKESELRGMLDIMPLLLTFFIPAITMKTISEERKSDTLQLILTLPLREWEVVLSKYLASVVLYLSMIGFTLIYVVVLKLIGRPDSGVITASYVGLLLLGTAYISIGIFASSLTRNQVIAFILGFAIMFAFFVLSRLKMLMPLSLQPVISEFSVIDHFDNLLRGVISLDDVVYFVLLNLVFLSFATYQIQRDRK